MLRHDLALALSLVALAGLLAYRRMTGTSAGTRNNNPGNIRATGIDWQGATGESGGFVTFAGAEWGIRAMARVLKTYVNHHGLTTVAGIVSRWAPPGDDNPTDAYINFVAGRLAVEPDRPIYQGGISHAQLIDLIDALIYFENGSAPYGVAFIEYGVGLA